MIEYTFGVLECLSKIFGGIIQSSTDIDEVRVINKVKNVNYSRFVADFPSNIFLDQYAIFYSIMVDKGIKIFNADELKTILDNNRDLILDSPFIRLDRIARLSNGNIATDDEKFDAIKSDVLDEYEKLKIRDTSEEEFNSASRLYIDWYKNQFMLETAQNMSQIMSDLGFDDVLTNHRRVHLHGTDDCKKYYNKRDRIISELSNTERVRITKIDTAWYKEDTSSEKQEDKKALMSVGLRQIDESYGDLRRSNMLGILGPPKGGKTRFTNYLVQRALSKGLNVCVWPLEGTSEEWMSMQIAAYIARVNGVYIDNKSILERKYRSEQERSLVATAKFNFVSDPKLGKLSFIEASAYEEDFIRIIESHYENDNPFDVIVIDSLVNILSRSGKNKVDRISSAYMQLKTFISTGLPVPALAIIPAQLKQEVVDYLRRNPDETLDVTAGGESSETVRSPDYVIGLFSSKEERAANVMKMYSVATRHSNDFSDFAARVQLKCCHFMNNE